MTGRSADRTKPPHATRKPLAGGTFEMRAMLEQGGFKIRGRGRADCIHCEGHSRGTVSFNDKLAHCFRCQWKANSFTLAQELGLLDGNRDARDKFLRDVRERMRFDADLHKFEAWRSKQIRLVSDQYLFLSRAANHAHKVLTQRPDCEEAWDCLARFHNAEAQLLAVFDWLTFAKASLWLEQDATPIEVFTTWRHDVA
jgi:hypothetical protein